MHLVSSQIIASASAADVESIAMVAYCVDPKEFIDSFNKIKKDGKAGVSSCKIQSVIEALTIYRGYKLSGCEGIHAISSSLLLELCTMEFVADQVDSVRFDLLMMAYFLDSGSAAFRDFFEYIEEACVIPYFPTDLMAVEFCKSLTDKIGSYDLSSFGSVDCADAPGLRVICDLLRNKYS